MNVLQEFLAFLKNSKARVACMAMLLVVTAAVVAFGVAPVAFADEDAKTEKTTATATADDAKDEKADAADKTGTELVAENAAEEPADEALIAQELPEDAFLIGNDTMWFGRTVDFSTYTATNDIIGAGETITFTDSRANGSIRIAGRIISLTNTTANESITIAGQDITVANGTANVMALAAKDVSFSGTANELWLCGSKVVINGTVTGDVRVVAGKLELGPNAQIAGTLSGSVGEEPTIDEGATIGTNKLVIEEDAPEEKDLKSLFDPISIVLSTLSCLLIALLSEWLAGGHTVGAANLLKSGAGGYFLASTVGVILLPIFIVVLCLPVVTIPAVIAALLVILAIGLVSTGFTAAMLGRLIFPNMGRFLAAGIMGVLLGAICAMPYVGAPMRTVAFLLMMGYVIRSLRVGMKERRRVREEEAVQF